MQVTGCPRHSHSLGLYHSMSSCLAMGLWSMSTLLLCPGTFPVDGWKLAFFLSGRCVQCREQGPDLSGRRKCRLLAVVFFCWW